MAALKLGLVVASSFFLLLITDHDRFYFLNANPSLPPNRISPVIINTWPFTEATEAAWKVLKQGDSDSGKGKALLAVEAGASKCEDLSCDFTVGFGGSPDESGETTLDAMIMDGDTMEVGAVANLRHIKQAVTAARLVKDYSRHSLLAGLQGSQFAQSMGLEPSNLTTEYSAKLHTDWLHANCQPNFRKNVLPPPEKNCGPYFPLPNLDESYSKSRKFLSEFAAKGVHDTISLVALDSDGSIASACSTNGAINKIPGRVGDGAIAGGGSYADSEVGGCGATGDGDTHIRFLPCYQVVENMRNGMGPKEAAEEAMYRIIRKLEKIQGRGKEAGEEGGNVGKIDYRGAVIALSKDGSHGAASYGWNFSYSYRNEASEGVQLVHVEPLKLL
jgi:N4-(beta-N-acetylglucosaminyl)-L-asparaginase